MRKRLLIGLLTIGMIAQSLTMPVMAAPTDSVKEELSEDIFTEEQPGEEQSDEAIEESEGDSSDEQPGEEAEEPFDETPEEEAEDPAEEDSEADQPDETDGQTDEPEEDQADTLPVAGEAAYDDVSDGIYQAGAFSVLDESVDVKIGPYSIMPDAVTPYATANTVAEAEEYLYEQLKARAIEIDISAYNIPLDDRRAFYSGVLNEHPDLYFVSGKFWFYNDGVIVTKIVPEYINDLDDAAFQSGLQDALSVVKPGMTELEKAIALHDYLVINCEYDYANYLQGTIPQTSYSAYGALVDGTVVCQGYALAYKLLLSKVGIDCYMVTSDSMNHAWNLIVLNGEYYQVDVTWDDPTWDMIGRAVHTYMFRSDTAFDEFRTGDPTKGHRDWEITSGSEVVKYTATDTRYDHAFWTDCRSPLVLTEDGCYYTSYANYSANIMRKESLENITGTGTTVQSIGRWPVWGNDNSLWPYAYSGLFMMGGRLYYNDKSSIYSIALDGTDRRTEFTADTTDGYIYGSALIRDKVLYCLRQTPNVTGKETVLTADIAVSQNYAITYILCGGINNSANPSTYTPETDTVILQDAVRNGYRFDGWYRDASYLTKVTQIPKGSRGNITLYAKWVSTTVSDIPTVDITPSDGNVVMGFPGTYYTESADKILKRLNEIRLEACEQGIIDPYTKQPLTLNDYVPLQWSSDLEVIARFRAAEATVGQGHTRPNGLSWDSVTTTNDEQSWAENLAWNDSGLMAGIEQWYGEKNDWVKQTSGKTTGHYENIISTKHHSVAVGAFRLTSGGRYAIAQEFSYKESMDEQKNTEQGQCTQSMEVQGSNVSAFAFNSNQASAVRVGETDQLSLDVTVKYADNSGTVKSYTGPYQAGGNWTSSDDTVLSVNDTGFIAAKAKGVVKVTVRAGSASASKEIMAYGTNDSPVIIQSPAKTTYKVGQAINLNGGKVTYMSGNKVVTTDIKTNMIRGFDSTRPGICTVNVTCGGYTSSFDTLIVEEPRLTALYGQRLSDVALPTNEHGTYSWQDGTQLLDTVSVQSFAAVFTPNDANAFQQLTDLKIQVTVRAELDGSTDVRFVNSSFTYNGREQKPKVTVSHSGNVLVEGQDYTLSYKNNTDVGEATVIVEGTNCYFGSVSRTFTINPAQLTITAKNKEILIGDPVPAEDEYEYAISGLASGDELITKPSFNCDIVSTDEAAEYDIIPSGADAGENYEITYVNGILTVKAAIIVQPPAKTTYKVGQTINLKGGKVTYLSGKTMKTVDLKTNMISGFDTTKPGICTVKVACGGYTSSFDTLIVEEPKLTALCGQNLSDVAFPSNDYGTYSWQDGTQTLGTVSVQTFAAVFTPNDANAFQQLADLKIQVTVQAELDDSADVTFKNSGFTYNGTEQEPKVVVSVLDNVLVEGQDYTLSYENNKDAGEATVIVEGTNCYFGSVSQRFTIDPAELTITAKDKEILIGDPVPVGDEYEYEISGFVSDDSLAVPPVISCDVKSKGTDTAGRYDIILSGADAGPNYIINYVNGTLTVASEYASCMVTFDVQGHGTVSPGYIIVNTGSTIEKPDIEEPGIEESERYQFDGWYKDVVCTKAWNFDTDIVQSDLTLYAKWLKESESGDFALQEIADVYYTGKAYKPAVSVYDVDSGALLKAGKDYQIKYYNNTNANKAGVLKEGSGTGEGFNAELPYVEITGKGNYTDVVKVNFNILPASIGDGSDNPASGVTLKVTDQLVTAKKAQKPFSSIKYVKSMKLGTDYTLSLTAVNARDQSGRSITSEDFALGNENVNVAIPAGYEGEFLLTVQGKGNYEGSICKRIWVTDKSHLIKNATITLGKNLKNVEYTGSSIELTPSEANSADTFTVKYGKVFLRYNKDYTVSYRNNVRVGKAELIITGMGEYAGSKSVSFNIKGKSFAAKTVTIDPNRGIKNQVYTGRAWTQNDVALIYGKGTDAEKELTYGTDYTISYSKNVNNGTATMTFKGVDAAGYSGSFKKTFKITTQNLSQVKQTEDMLNKAITVSYTKAGTKPVDQIVLINSEGFVLSNGKDYTLKYANNKAVADATDEKKPPTIIIKGKGNYTGELKVYYNIAKADLDREIERKSITVKVSSVGYQKNKAAGYAYKPSIKLMDGKTALRAGTDYVIAYEKNTQADYENYMQKLAEGADIDDDDMPRAVITGKEGSNYKMNGYKTIPLPIYQTKLTKSNLTVEIEEAVYTGSQAKPEVTVYYKGEGGLVPLEEGSDYSISYGSNIASGKNKGSVTISGTAPNYGGDVTVKFNIVRKPIQY